MERQSEAQHKQTAVERVPGSCVDAGASKCRTIAGSRQRCKRPSEGDPAQDQHHRTSCFEREAEHSEPWLNAGRPARPYHGANGHRGEDDRLQNDPPFTATSQRRRVHGMMLCPLRIGCRSVQRQRLLGFHPSNRATTARRRARGKRDRLQPWRSCSGQAGRVPHWQMSR
jgi:hypothetical protein